MGTFVKVTTENIKYIERLAKAINVPNSVYAGALAQAAYYHIQYIEQETPQQISGKITAEVGNIEGEEITITYRPKAGAEASTFTLPKAGGSVFISQDKLGASSTRASSYTPTGGQGIFVSKINVGGRPSIEAWVMAQVAAAVPGADEATAAESSQTMYAAIADWFQTNGIRWNASLSRYQASSAGTLFTGKAFSAGSIISGRLG